MGTTNQTPSRPFGVTLAIIASIVVYSILPLFYIGVVMLIEQRLNEVGEVSIPVDGEEIAPTVSGGNVDLGVGTVELAIQATLSLSFLVIAFVTWRGRSQIVRYLFLATVMGLSISMIALQLLPFFEANTEGITGGSMEALFSAMSNGHILMMIILPIYVVWYLNRGPARAFFRGYYLDKPEADSS